MSTATHRIQINSNPSKSSNNKNKKHETDVENSADGPDSTITIPSSDIIRLIQAYLLEVGGNTYLQTIRTLQRESLGIGLAGALPHQHVNFYFHACSGQWTEILKTLSVLDRERVREINSLTEASSTLTVSLEDVTAMVHEMVILELAEANDFDVAYATYRMVQQQLEQSMITAEEGRGIAGGGTGSTAMSRSRVLEQKLAALHSRRVNDPDAPLPPDFYYGDDNSETAASDAKQFRREMIGGLLQDVIPKQPAKRLPALLQQAIKWQLHTGQLPTVRQHYYDEDAVVEEEELQEGKDAGKLSRKKRKRRTKKIFDLVLGEASVDELPVGTTITSNATSGRKKSKKDDPIVSDPFAVIKIGKKCTAESAVFLPNTGSGSESSSLILKDGGLVTGSSDGLIEIWDPSEHYEKLRMDLPYQASEELLGHDGDKSGESVAVTALSTSNDGTLLVSGASNGQVKVWRIDTGKCLRSWKAYDGSSISCLAFSHDGSHVLTASHGGTCREFGLRTTRMLKEFRGHSSYISSCSYRLTNMSDTTHADREQLLVITASGDGSVRLWDSKTLDVVRVLRPVSIGASLNELSKIGSSIVVDAQSSEIADSGAPSIHTVLHLHTPAATMIIVARGYRAFLVSYAGIVLRTFQDDGPASEKVFVAATVSSSNKWLYAVKEDGVCCVFDVDTGDLEKTIRDFGSETSRMPKESSAVAEISCMVHHPTKSLVASFSNDKGQKKGQLMLWK